MRSVKHSIPLIEAQARERKHDIAEQYLRKNGNTHGVDCGAPLIARPADGAAGASAGHLGRYGDPVNPHLGATASRPAPHLAAGASHPAFNEPQRISRLRRSGATGRALTWFRLRTRREITASMRLLVRRYDIVPFAVKLVSFDVDLLHLLVGHLHPFGVNAGVQFAVDLKTLPGGGGADQLHDHLVADQRLTTPVLRDVGEQAVLDTVPLCALPKVH